MTDTTEQLVHTYYETLKDGMASFDAERLRAILAPDLVFEGPIAGSVVGAERFVKGVSGFAETMRGLTIVHQVRAGDEAAALYDAEMPGGTVRFAEFFHVADARIQTLRLLYDAAEYRARGGR
ncbi:MAG: nuclear transport factor 2 family protein [Actinomycetota bacterium]|nr:nuclear transport factor 2 family protein [Actinomycetota bacterium]